MSSNYICLYCGKEIKKNEILFWESTKGTNTDDIRGNFLRHHGVEVPSGNKFNRKYYYPKWDANGNSINVIREDENGYPLMLEDSPKNAVAPEDLKISTKEDDSFGDDAEFDGFDGNAGGDRTQENEEHRIPNRACPYCHCELPMQFGTLDTYHVAMFGGRASGKTSYLINLFQQVQHQLSMNNLGSLELAVETKNFLQPKIEYYERNNTIQATMAEDGLLPIVCRYKNGSREAFITFYDIAGEGTVRPEYMANHEGIRRCESLLLMIDPNMFEQGSYFQEWMASRYENADLSKADDCCKDTIDEFLNVAGTYCREYSDHITNIICVITKLDMLLEAEAASFGSGDVELISDVGGKHRDAVSLATLSRVSKDLNTFITNRFHVNLPEKIKEAFGEEKHVALLGVSTSTIQKGTNGKRFTFKADAAAVNSKHRIVEPFLVVLMYFGLVNARKADGSVICYRGRETQVVAEPPKEHPKKKGFFAKLFGK